MQEGEKGVFAFIVLYTCKKNNWERVDQNDGEEISVSIHTLIPATYHYDISAFD